MSLHNFNPNNKSWKMYTNTITSISGDNITIKPYEGKNLLLEVSANNNILFKRGDISYGLDDLIGGGNSNIILTSVSGNIIPSTDNAFKLGDVSKNWSNAYIQNISATHMTISGDFILNISGTATNVNTRLGVLDNSFINVNTRLGVLDNSFTNVNTRLGVLDTSFVNVNTRLGVLDSSFINVNTRLGVLDSSFINVNTRLGVLDSSFVNVNTRLGVLDGSFTNVNTRLGVLDSSFVNVNTRLSTLDTSFINVNTRLSTLDTSFVNVNTRLGTLDSSFVNVNTRLGTLDSSFINVNTRLSTLDSSFITLLTLRDLSVNNDMTISGNLIPLKPIASDLGSTNNLWRNAYIQNISATHMTISENMSISGNIVPLNNINNFNLGLSTTRWNNLYVRNIDVSGDISNVRDICNIRQIIPRLGIVSDISTSLGTSSNIWQRAFINDLSGIISINGATWPLTSDFSGTDITTSLIPRDTSSIDLGSSSKLWRNAYMQDLNVNNISVSGNITICGSPVYTKTQIDASFVSKQSFDTSYNNLLTSIGNIGNTGTSTTNYDTTLTIKNNIDLNQLHYDSNWYYKGQLINKTSCITGLGKTLALSDDGRTIVIGSNKNGLANAIPEIYVYYFIENSWVQKGLSIKGTSGSYFGKKVAISGNGEVISISDIKGNIYLYKWKYNITNTYNTNPLIGAWTKLGATIIQEPGNGISMSLNYSGDKMATGSYLATTLQSDMINNYTIWQGYVIKQSSNIGYGMNNLFRICWNGSFFAAIGQSQSSQSVATISYDGKIWTDLALINTGTSYNSICWNGSIFCAVGGSVIITSIDGLIWTSRTSPAFNWVSICWGKNMFVAISTTSAFGISIDGINWSTVSVPTGYNWRCICRGKDIFVVTSGSIGAVLTSYDGIIWTLTTVLNANWVSICWNGSIFCALNNDSSIYRVMTSSDGTTWIYHQATAINRQPRSTSSICWNGTIFCTLTGDGLLYSYDGIYWVCVESFFSPPTSATWQPPASICSNDSIIVGISVGSEKHSAAFVSPHNFPNTTPTPIYNFSVKSRWNSNYNPLNNTFTSICFGNNIFVAISNTGITNNRVIVSYNGIDWYPSTSGIENNNWTSVAFGYDKFCAVADTGYTSNRIMISYDGINWQSIYIIEKHDRWKLIVWGYDKFIIFPNPNSVNNSSLMSSDGINWTSVRFDGLNFTSAVWGNNIFVGVASTGTTHRVHHSFDRSASQTGATWTNLTTPALNNWTSVCWGNNIFIAVASSGTGNRIMRSTDGTTWNLVTSPADSGWSSVTFGNNTFVAVATTGTFKIMYSTDNTGSTWYTSSFISNNSFIGITFGNGIFCAVANSGLSNTRAITSFDGITWNSTNSQMLTSNWNSICWNGSIFCAVASSDISNVRVKVSSDGNVWSTSINGILNNSWRSICWNGSIFCALASSGNTNQRVMISVNGLQWTNATSGVLDSSWMSICWNGSIFCAVANSGNQNERVMTSSNGLNWTNATSGVQNSSWTSICWNGYIFCAVASSGNTNERVMTSSNGLVWNNAIAGVLDNSWTSICWNGYIFCAVASSGTNRVMISNDGLNWTSYNMNLPDTYWSSICWNGNFFCAVANGGLGNRVATSYDGITWTSRTSIYENNNWNSICWNGSIFCAIASSGSSRAMTSSINYGKEYLYKINECWEIITGTLNNNYTGVGFAWTGESILIASDGSSNSQWLFTSPGNLKSYGSVNVLITQKSWQSIADSDISFCIVADNATGNDCILTFSKSNAVSNATASWLNATSGVVNSTWNSICWSGDRFCAVARSGATTNQQVMISFDGRIWQNAVSGVPNSSWVSVCWGKNMFCAVANNGEQRVMTSLDGLTWTGRVSNPSDSNWTSITWGNNLFCAVADSGTLRVMISYDGITWTGIASNPPSNNWTSITWGNDIFCAVANNSTNSLMTSQDGISWTYDKDINNPWNHVSWNKYKNLFMVFSSKTQTSGIRYMISSLNYGTFLYTKKSYWYSQSLTANTSVSNLSSITWAGDRFCAIGTSFAITSIDNGNTWTRYSLGSGLTFNDLVYANGILLARSGKSLIRSLDKGNTWSSVYTLNAMLSQPSWNGLRSANNMFFIPFDWYTTDYSLGVSIYNSIMYSTNGIDFSLCRTPSTIIRYAIGNIVWSSKLNIFVGVQYISNSYFTSWSYDGITWYLAQESFHRARHLNYNANTGASDIVWSPEQNFFIAIGGASGIIISYNGTKWQEIPNITYQEINYNTRQGGNLLWNGNNFFSYSDNTKYLWSSSDGSNWMFHPDISNSNFLSNVITITKLASDGNGKICGVGNVSGTSVIIRFSDNYGYDFPGVAFKNGNVRIYDIQDINYVPSSENNFGHREIGYFETANESEKTSLSVEMSSDGKTVVAGFPSSDSSGNSVKIYTYENNTWKSLANQIKDLSLNSNYNFGTSVATSANGSIIAVAAMSSNGTTNGYVKVYKAQNTYPKTYVQLGNTIETNFGTPITFYNSSAFDVSYQNNLLIDISFQNKCLALSANGYVLTVGNMNDFNTKGSVKTYMYNTTNNSWNVIKDISGANIGDRYGLEVHMPKYDYNTLAWSADPSNISTSVINYGYSGTITY